MIKKLIFFASFFAFFVVFAQKTHTVSKGESAYAIAKKYGMTLQELYRLNPSIENGTLAIGQKLILSKNGSTTPIASRNEIGQIIIQPKQTIYGLTRQYKISESELRKLNPDLDNQMKIGSRVNLPMDKIKKYAGNQEIVSQETETTNPPITTPIEDIKPVEPKNAPTYSSSNVIDEYLTYTVQTGDTTFGIVNKFDITIDELIRLNPDLSSGLKPGMVLRIKKLDAAYVKKDNNALNVVLMLPFGYDSGDSKYRNMSMDFLSGARLAIERNAARGQKLDIKIIDAGNESTFKNSLTQLNRDNTDLIIGPLFKSSVIEVLDYVKEQKIPVVAPFANSEDLLGYSNLVIVETNDQIYADRIVEEIKNVYSNQKIYILSGSDKTHANYIKTNLEKKLKNTNIVLVNSANSIVLETNMMTGQSAPIISVLADKSDSLGNSFADRMIELSEEVTGNRAFSMFYVSNFLSKEEKLRSTNLVYTIDTKIDTNGSFENEILNDFERKYCKKPSRYAVIGFDIVNDMLSRENSKGELFKQIEKPQTQLATKFQFVKSKSNGAYVNTGYRVVRLIP